jgi:hypothetical protein
MKTKWLLLFICIFLFGPAVASDDNEYDNLPFDGITEMARWCKEESYSHFSFASDNIYNWRKRVIRKGNMFVVRGRWRVDGEDVYVECRSRIGAKRKFATFRVMGEEEL